MQRAVVRFSVLRVTAPQGAFSAHATLWSTIPGRLADANSINCLKDNGFRAVIGTEADRGTLKNLLDQVPDQLSALDQLTPNEGRLVEFDLGPCAPVQTVFHFDRGGKLHGAEFHDGRSRLRLAYEIRSTRLDEVWLQLVPEIEEPPGPPTWKITPNGAMQVQEERRHTFRELIFGGKIPPGGFLLLGPTADIYRQPLLGRAFFVDQTQSEHASSARRESVLVISPNVTTYSGPRPAADSR